MKWSREIRKNLIVVISVVTALFAGTVLLGSYAGSKAAETEAPVKACHASGGGCPMTAKMVSCPKMAAAQAESTGCSGTPCTEDCPKQCCAVENTKGCDNPCPIPCPKTCCAEDGSKGCGGTAKATGCPMTAAETDDQ